MIIAQTLKPNDPFCNYCTKYVVITQVGVHFCRYQGVGKGRHCEARPGNKAVHSVVVVLPNLHPWQRKLTHSDIVWYGTGTRKILTGARSYGWYSKMNEATAIIVFQRKANTASASTSTPIRTLKVLENCVFISQIMFAICIR
jgi:hypothetical protein